MLLIDIIFLKDTHFRSGETKYFFWRRRSNHPGNSQAKGPIEAQHSGKRLNSTEGVKLSGKNTEGALKVL